MYFLLNKFKIQKNYTNKYLIVFNFKIFTLKVKNFFNKNQKDKMKIIFIKNLKSNDINSKIYL